jgi:hypothetical protein
MVWVERKSYLVAGAALALLLAGLLVGRLANTASSTVGISTTPGAVVRTAAASHQETPGQISEAPEMTLSIKFRAVSLNKATGRPEADKLVAYAVLDEIRHSPAFDPEKTQIAAGLSANEEPGTYTWSIVAGLKPSMKN